MDGLRWTLLVIAVLIIAAIYWWGRRARRAQALRDEPSQGTGLEWRDPPDDVLMAEEFERLSGMISADRGAKPARNSEHASEAQPTSARARGDAPSKSTADPELEPDFQSEAPAAESSPAPKPAPKPILREALAAVRSRAFAAPAAQAIAPTEPLIVVLHVMARAGLLEGEDIGAALNAVDMHYGDMDIYHRLDLDGQPLFGAASMIKPGTLTPAELPALRTPGVALFMQAPLAGASADVKQVFEDMLEAARAVAQALGAELRDETRSVLTPQTVAHLRERVETFEFKQRVAARSR